MFVSTGTTTTEIYPLSLHDALPISPRQSAIRAALNHGAFSFPSLIDGEFGLRVFRRQQARSHIRACKMRADRKSTRLNSSHTVISYAVFCLKKKTRDTRHRCKGWLH